MFVDLIGVVFGIDHQGPTERSSLATHLVLVTVHLGALVTGESAVNEDGKVVAAEDETHP